MCHDARCLQGGHAPAFSKFATNMIDCLGSEEREVLRNYWNVKGAFVIQYEPIKQTLALPALCKEEVDSQVRRTRGCEWCVCECASKTPPRACASSRQTEVQVLGSC